MADVTVQNESSIVLIRPSTKAAVDWLEEHVGEDNGYQPYWPVAVVEPRYVGPILDAMDDAGLTVVVQP